MKYKFIVFLILWLNIPLSIQRFTCLHTAHFVVAYADPSKEICSSMSSSHMGTAQ